ncbi:MAG: polysaccharide deacetylase family protein, partial [Bacillota bacterium]|nr:polysaccharide deacetylase family protein [Bacillota bacterium]
DDFGASRSYGYSRLHFGHDLLVSTGTPVVAVESGIVEALGWNQYGGWRIGIRSLDGKRYYYYAHLRKGTPYAPGLYVGKAVAAGDVIGYSGQTGYSIKENVNNIDTPHLHYGMQLIFDEGAKDSPNQIWVDLYAITKLLSRHRSAVEKDPETEMYRRSGSFSEENAWGQGLPEEEQAAAAAAAARSLAPEDSTAVPILMYHGFLKDPSMQNQFVISPSLLESDLQYLKERGYTTVFMKELLACVKEGLPLPEKPVVLTFDDGYYNNYLYAYPLLRQYEMKGVFNVIGSSTEEFSRDSADANHATYSHMTWTQLREMQASGFAEIQNHSYDLHTYDQGRKGIRQKQGESAQVYRQVLSSDVGFLQDRFLEELGQAATTFAYPFGFFNEDSVQYLKELGFEATLSCTEGINYIVPGGDPEVLWNLKRILRPPDKSSESFFGQWGIE